jgi:hypothetical protein
MPPRHWAYDFYPDASRNCGTHAWTAPNGVWKCFSCGYLLPNEEQARAVPSHANEKKTDRIVPSHTDELKSHFDAGLRRLVEDILRQLRPKNEQLLNVVEESRAEVATLAATVAEMRDTIQVPPGGKRRAAQRATDQT